MKSIKVERVRLFPNVGNFRTILSSPCLSSTFALTDFSLQMMLFFSFFLYPCLASAVAACSGYLLNLN